MNFDQLSPKQRLKDWRDFRQTLTGNQTDHQQLLKTELYWSQWPYVSHLLDPDNPQTWPSPWEIVNQGTLCPISLPYMVEQTLLMSDDRWYPQRFELVYVDDRKICTMFMLLIVDAKYVANYSRNEIKDFDSIKQNCVIINEYTPSNHYRHQIKQD